VLASTTDAVAAWSTFAAVVVALRVSLVPVWWRWHKRPFLKWTVGRDEPHRLAIVGQSGINAGWDLRIFVGNKAGRRRAENVRAQLRTFWVCTTVEGLNAWGDLGGEASGHRASTSPWAPHHRQGASCPVGV
jgi:hypothetical protein